jgi:hypothetical protein
MNVIIPGMVSSIHKLFFLNSSVGFVSGGSPDTVLYKSQNGGLTWSTIPAPEPWYYLSVHFLTQQTGFAGYDKLYKTTNGGIDWILTLTPAGWLSNDRIIAIEFRDTLHGYALTKNWHLYKTSDGGDHWDLSNMPVSSGGFCSNFQFDQKQYGYMIGYDVHAPLISKDAGNNWSIDASYNNHHPPTCLATSSSHLIALGTSTGFVALQQLSPANFNNPLLKPSTPFHPNPCHDELHIGSDYEVDRAEIFNADGAILAVFTSQRPNPLRSINLSSIPNGIYSLKLSNELYSASYKLIKN